MITKLAPYPLAIPFRRLFECRATGQIEAKRPNHIENDGAKWQEFLPQAE
jgi:hypothetical protein